MEPIVMERGLGFLEDLSERLHAQVRRSTPAANEIRLAWDSQMVRGHVSFSEVRPGLDMRWSDIRNEVPWQAEMLHQPLGLELNFNISCGFQVECDSDELSHLGPMRFCVSHAKEATRVRCKSIAGSRDRSLSLCFGVGRLEGLLGGQGLPRVFEQVLADPRPLSFHSAPITRPMVRVIEELNHCRIYGSMRQLYLEGKSLELLALAADNLSGVECTTLGVQPRSDEERLEHARTRLLDGLSEPPTLRDLAHQCGLNERKLKEGFKRRFGTTVFGFVRQQRMETAHDLLRRRGRTVTEVAQLVGYSNPSKFAAAFRRQFGMSPSTVAPLLTV